MIILKTLSQIDGLRKSGGIVAYVLSELKREIKPGITTSYLNEMAEDLCFQKGGVPGFKGYKGFPYSICASKNEEIVHGFPDDVPLKEGDILSIDFGAIRNGWYGDSAFTVGVGKISRHRQILIDSCRKCLYNAIDILKPGIKIGDVSSMIQLTAAADGFDVIKNFVGHGIGKILHEEPQIPNFGKPGEGLMLKSGAVIAIEPMLVLGSDKSIILGDGWTVKTEDRLPSAHYEHTVAIIGDEIEILTDRKGL